MCLLIRLSITTSLVLLLNACTTESEKTSNDSVTTHSTPDNCAQTEFAQNMLASINQYRAEARMCGNDEMPAVEPLSWNCSLQQSSLNHANDMGSNNFFSHTSSNGLQLSHRINAVEYDWQAIGENIAGGQTSINEVMTGWINSEGHCRNIMSANFTEVGAATVVYQNSNARTYWVQNFAAPWNR